MVSWVHDGTPKESSQHRSRDYLELASRTAAKALHLAPSTATGGWAVERARETRAEGTYTDLCDFQTGIRHDRKCLWTSGLNNRRRRRCHH